MCNLNLEIDSQETDSPSVFKYESRGNPYKIVKPRANKTVCLNSFSHRVINNWNNLASEHVCAESVTICKTRLDKSWISK